MPLDGGADPRAGGLEVPEVLLDADEALARADGRLDDAEEFLGQALSQMPDRADLWNNMGIVLLDAEKYDDAEAVLKKAIQLSPELVPAHSNLGNVYAATRRLELAREQYRKALELNPAFKDAIDNLAAVEKMIGNQSREHDGGASSY